MDHYDFIAIGSGPAGQRGAIQAAKLGKRVALVERHQHVGGVALHTGTIPSKTLREAILYLTGWRQRGFHGQNVRIRNGIAADDLKQRLSMTIRHEIDVVHQQLVRNGVQVIHGEASFLDPHTLHINNDVDSQRIQGDAILIATGTRPVRPDHIPFDDRTIVDADSILDLQTVPHSLAVVGAGVIGVEYATMFNIMNVLVTLINKHDAMLPFVDDEIMDEFIHSQRDNHMEFRFGEELASVEKRANGGVVTKLKSGKQIISDMLLYCAGRIGCTSALKLENAGLEADSRHNLKVNEHFQTSVPHIYAAGDVIGFPALASTSMEQGRQVALHVCGKGASNGLGDIPYGIYSIPEISMIGKTEQQLKREGIAYEIGQARIRETARGQILGLREGLLKILVGLDDHKILGVHIVGQGATELIHIGQMAMQMNGKLDDFVHAPFNYPTLAEAYKVAALDCWNRLNS